MELQKDTYFIDKDNNTHFFEKGTDLSFIEGLKHLELKKLTDKQAQDRIKPNLNEVKQGCKCKIKKLKSDFESEIIFNGMIFKNSLNERLIVKELIDTYEDEIEFVTKDNKIVVLNLSDLQNLYKLMVRKNSEKVLKDFELKRKIENAKNEDEIKKLMEVN